VPQARINPAPRIPEHNRTHTAAVASVLFFTCAKSVALWFFALRRQCRETCEILVKFDIEFEDEMMPVRAAKFQPAWPEVSFSQGWGSVALDTFVILVMEKS
jgi:hypothetical protein